jgi:hypothetical protein
VNAANTDSWQGDAIQVSVGNNWVIWYEFGSLFKCSSSVASSFPVHFLLFLSVFFERKVGVWRKRNSNLNVIRRVRFTAIAFVRPQVRPRLECFMCRKKIDFVGLDYIENWQARAKRELFRPDCVWERADQAILVPSSDMLDKRIIQKCPIFHIVSSFIHCLLYSRVRGSSDDSNSLSLVTSFFVSSDANDRHLRAKTSRQNQPLLFVCFYFKWLFRWIFFSLWLSISFFVGFAQV